MASNAPGNITRQEWTDFLIWMDYVDRCKDTAPSLRTQILEVKIKLFLMYRPEQPYFYPALVYWVGRLDSCTTQTEIKDILRQMRLSTGVDLQKMNQTEEMQRTLDLFVKQCDFRGEHTKLQRLCRKVIHERVRDSNPPYTKAVLKGGCWVRKDPTRDAIKRLPLPRSIKEYEAETDLLDVCNARMNKPLYMVMETMAQNAALKVTS